MIGGCNWGLSVLVRIVFKVLVNLMLLCKTYTPFTPTKLG